LPTDIHSRKIQAAGMEILSPTLGKELKRGHWALAGVESYENICNDCWKKEKTKHFKLD
jgi:hypothetical protein